MSDKGERAVEKFLSGYNCAQSVIYAFLDDLPMDGDAALKLASGLGAGLGRRQDVCGAVTGAILVLGLRHGRGLQDDISATERTYLLVRDLMQRFADKQGSCLCRELLNNCDLLTEEGQKHFKDNDLRHKTCAECVRTAVEILQDIL